MSTIRTHWLMAGKDTEEADPVTEQHRVLALTREIRVRDQEGAASLVLGRAARLYVLLQERIEGKMGPMANDVVGGSATVSDSEAILIQEVLLLYQIVSGTAQELGNLVNATRGLRTKIDPAEVQKVFMVLASVSSAARVEPTTCAQEGE